jgi:hypothetical protein
MYFVFLYENRRMKPVEIDLRRLREGEGRKMEKVDLIKMYCKHICIPLYNYTMLIKITKKLFSMAQLD